MAKAVTYRYVKCVKIAISYINSFFIFLLVNIAAVMAEEGSIGIISISQCPGIGHLSRRSDIAADHISKCISTFLTGLHKLQNGTDIGKFICKSKVYKTAGIDYQNYILIRLTDLGKQCFFFCCDQIIAFRHGSVCIFTGNSAQDKNCDVSSICPCSFYIDGTSAGHLKLRCGVGTKEIIVIFRQAFENLIPPVFSCLNILGIIVIQPLFAGYFIACIYHTLINIYTVTFIYITGSGATLDGFDRTGTVKSDSDSFRQRKKVLIIL